MIEPMFWKRFYDLCKKNNLKPLNAVNNLSIGAGSITKWKNGTIPNSETLIKLADFFDCSIDYLLCRTDDADESVTVNKSSCSDDDLKKLFADGYELKYMTIWEGDPDTVSITMKKKNLKTADHTLDEYGEIAAFGSENPHPTTELPDDEQSLLDSYRVLDTYDKGEISGTIKQMLRADKYSNQDESYLA